MTTTERKEANVMGPYELLDEVKAFIVRTIPEQHFEQDSFTKDPHIEEMVREINKLTYEMKKILERR